MYTICIQNPDSSTLRPGFSLMTLEFTIRSSRRECETQRHAMTTEAHKYKMAGISQLKEFIRLIGLAFRDVDCINLCRHI